MCRRVLSLHVPPRNTQTLFLSRPKLAGMSLVAERPHNKYGSAILIRDSLKVENVYEIVQGTVELITIIMSGVVVHYVYKPPKDQFALTALGHRDLLHIVIRYFNRHSTSWGYDTTDNIHIGYHNKLTDRPKTTTDTTQRHSPSSKSEKNLIILQVNINGIKNKLEELKLLIHDTHADITIQATKLTPKAKTPIVHNFTTVRTDRLHKAGGGLITFIRDNITLTTTDIPSTINTHNTELQMVKVHINNTKHITIANIHIPPRDSTSTHYKTAGTDIQHCIQYITNIPHSVLTGDVNAHSILCHSYTDYHRGQLIADDISNMDHITLNTNTPARVPSTILQQTSSPDITTVSNTLYNRTLWTTQHALSSGHLPIITTINIRHDYILHQNRQLSPTARKLTGHNSRKTQSTLSLRPTYTLPT